MTHRTVFAKALVHSDANFSLLNKDKVFLEALCVEKFWERLLVRVQIANEKFALRTVQ